MNIISRFTFWTRGEHQTENLIFNTKNGAKIISSSPLIPTFVFINQRRLREIRSNKSDSWQRCGRNLFKIFYRCKTSFELHSNFIHKNIPKDVAYQILPNEFFPFLVISTIRVALSNLQLQPQGIISKQGLAKENIGIYRTNRLFDW